MKTKSQIHLYTLVQHSGFGFAGKPQFQEAVEEACLTSRREVERVRRAGGLLFHTYLRACNRVEAENYPSWIKGLIPHVAGEFAKAKVGGLRIYQPAPRGKLKRGKGWLK